MNDGRSEQSPETRRTRRGVIGLVFALGSAFLAATWLALGADRGRRGKLARAVLPRPVTDGISLTEDVILLHADGTLRALSRRCPHLGCRLNLDPKGLLVCPCHGSRFDREGKRLGGPATKDLLELAVREGPAEELIEVDLER